MAGESLRGIWRSFCIVGYTTNVFIAYIIVVAFGLAFLKEGFVVGWTEVNSVDFVQLVKLFRILIEKFRVRRFPFGDGEELGTIPADLAVNGVPEFFAGIALGLLIKLESRILLVSRITKLVDT